MKSPRAWLEERVDKLVEEVVDMVTQKLKRSVERIEKSVIDHMSTSTSISITSDAYGRIGKLVAKALEDERRQSSKRFNDKMHRIEVAAESLLGVLDSTRADIVSNWNRDMEPMLNEFRKVSAEMQERWKKVNR